MDDVDDFECDDFDKTLKVIVVGNGNVGKTSMTTRYAKGRYTGNYKKTIGVDFMEKRLELRDLGETVNLMIWDTAGQEEFGALTSRYYKGAGAVIYVFSTTDRASFDALPNWQRKVEEECGRISQVLVQNKIDLIDDAAMSRREVEDMADDMGLRLFRTCVQDNVNVKEVFEHLCRQYLRYGTKGGASESLQAVADITTLSEAAAAAALKGSQPSPSYERRSRGGRDLSDASDGDSTVSGEHGRRESPRPSPPRDRSRGGRDRDREDSRESGRFDRADGEERGARKNRRGEYYDDEDEDEDEDKDDRRSARGGGSRRDDRQRGWDAQKGARDDRDRSRSDGHGRRSDGERDGERLRDRDRERGRNNGRDRERDRDRDGERDRDRDRDRERDRDRDRDRGRDRPRDRDRDDDRDRPRDRDRDRDGERPRERDDRDRGDRSDRDRARERGRDHDRQREDDRGRDGGTKRGSQVAKDLGDDRARARGRADEDREPTEHDEVDNESSRAGDRDRKKPRDKERDERRTAKDIDAAKVDSRGPKDSASTKEASLRKTESDAGAPVPPPQAQDQEGHTRDSRQNSRSMRESEQGVTKDKKSTSTPHSEKTSEHHPKKPFDKSTLRAQLREGQDDSEEESEAAAGGPGAGGKTSTAASESSRVQPSKRRTNGKKTNPLLHKMSKLVYG